MMRWSSNKLFILLEYVLAKILLKWVLAFHLLTFTFQIKTVPFPFSVCSKSVNVILFSSFKVHLEIINWLTSRVTDTQIILRITIFLFKILSFEVLKLKKKMGSKWKFGWSECGTVRRESQIVQYILWLLRKFSYQVYGPFSPSCIHSGSSLLLSWTFLILKSGTSWSRTLLIGAHTWLLQIFKLFSLVLTFDTSPLLLYCFTTN